MDRLTKEQRSLTMSKIHSSMTGFEKGVFRALKKCKVKFSTHYKKVIGTPDIVVSNFRRAVFLHSDFWHGWQLSRWEKILPNEFWKNKLNKNKKRDKFVARKLRKMGWKVLTIWEHQIDRDFDGTIKRIINFLNL